MEAQEPFYASPGFWVGLAFFVFLGVLIYYRVHAMIIGALDERSARIRAELDEARRLREEAQALLATYERKQRDAMSEAEEMVRYAEVEAKREAEQARQKLQDTIERRQQLALEKIALAEAQAEKEVREAAIEVAIEAARRVIAGQLSSERAEALVDDAIKDLRRHLN